MKHVSAHAHQRIDFRTAHTSDEVKRLVAERSIPFSQQPDGRTRRLFYAPADNAYFIAVVARDGTLLTIMPAEWKAGRVPLEALKMAKDEHPELKKSELLPPPKEAAPEGRRIRLKLRKGHSTEYRLLGHWDFSPPCSPSQLDVYPKTQPAFAAWVVTQASERGFIEGWRHADSSAVQVRMCGCFRDIGTYTDYLSV